MAVKVEFYYHRLHSEASKTWDEAPLINRATVSNLIRGTTTETGLTASAELVKKVYKKGIKIPPQQMVNATLNMDYLSAVELCHLTTVCAYLSQTVL